MFARNWQNNLRTGVCVCIYICIYICVLINFIYLNIYLFTRVIYNIVRTFIYSLSCTCCSWLRHARTDYQLLFLATPRAARLPTCSSRTARLPTFSPRNVRLPTFSQRTTRLPTFSYDYHFFATHNPITNFFATQRTITNFFATHSPITNFCSWLRHAQPDYKLLLLATPRTWIHATSRNARFTILLFGRRCIHMYEKNRTCIKINK